MRIGLKTFVSFVIGVLHATLCTAQNRTTTPVPIRCLNGRIVSPFYGSQHCECNAGFTGYACDQLELTAATTFRCVNGRIFYLSSYPDVSKYCVCNYGYMGSACEIAIPNPFPPKPCVNGVMSSAKPVFQPLACDLDIPTIRCVNGVICGAGTLGQYCLCNPGFIGSACDVDHPQPCVANGNQNGEIFNIDCNVCSCRNATLICTKMLCEVLSTTPPPIRCVNGFINTPSEAFPYCMCNRGFTGEACDVPITIRCVNGVIVGTADSQFCSCKFGFNGPACDVDENRPCVDNGKTYQNGERFNMDCNVALCQNGWITRTQMSCGGISMMPYKPPIDCVHGIWSNPVPLYCMCHPEFTGFACDIPIPTTRCVNGVIAHAGTLGQYCQCYPGFWGAACDWDMQQLPECRSARNYVFLIVGVSVSVLILVAVILAVVFVCKRRQRLNNQHSAVHARRLPRDLRNGVNHGIYAILGDHDVKLPPYTPPKSSPPYDHLDYKRASLVDGKDYLSQPPPHYINPGYETMASVRKESVGNENVSVESDNVKSKKAGE